MQPAAFYAVKAVENGTLAASFEKDRAGAPQNPLRAMVREHEDILVQLELIEDCWTPGEPEAGELGVYCGLLAGSLAKHEYREENDLFSRCGAAWGRKSAAAREEVMARVAKMLAQTPTDPGHSLASRL